jgi:hypothetical protein
MEPTTGQESYHSVEGFEHEAFAVKFWNAFVLKTVVIVDSTMQGVS